MMDLIPDGNNLIVIIYENRKRSNCWMDLCCSFLCSCKEGVVSARDGMVGEGEGGV